MEITGFFVAASAPTFGIVLWFILSRLLKKGKMKKENLENIAKNFSKELEKLYKDLSEESYRNLNLIFLDKTRELLDGQKRSEDIFLFKELKYASIYLEQFAKLVRIGNKNPYLIYKTKGLLSKSMESIPSFYVRKRIEEIISALEIMENTISS
jgi:hypothetical protein